MKCPSCGAEIGANKVCEFCGSTITSEMQREAEQLRKEGCPKCGSSNITFRRENQGEVRGKNQKVIVHRTVGLCKDCGYTWYPNMDDAPPTKRKTWLWVLGWIIIFPVPLTLILLKKKDMKPALRYGLIAAAWILYLIIGFAGGDSADNNTSESTAVVEESTSIDTSTTTSEEESSDSSNRLSTSELIDSFVDEFNKSSSEQLTFIEEFGVQDKESGHYRTEFRLNAYDNAVGKAYSLGDSSVDIIMRETILLEPIMRIYTDKATFDDCLTILEVASPIMDPDITSDELNEMLSYVKEHKYANGYYYADLGIVLLGNDNTGYDLMLKED